MTCITCTILFIKTINESVSMNTYTVLIHLTWYMDLYSHNKVIQSDNLQP